MPNHLAIRTVIALLVPSAACVVETHRDRGGGGDSGATISARWSLRNMADGATTACPVGFDTVQMIAHAVDASGDAVGDPSVDLFDCDARTGRSAVLPSDIYQVWLEIRSHDLATLYAQSLSQVLDVRTADRTITADLLNDGGYFQLTWDLVDATTHRPVECSQVVGLDTIEAVSTSVADAHVAYDDQRVCQDHAAVSGGLLQGSYTITINAMAGGRSVGAAAMLTHQVIQGQNRVTDLGNIIIPIVVP